MFKKAQRKLAKLRLGVCGTSGSGKTWSSLLIASGISDKIALLDTERRGHLYAEDFAFDIAELDAPYSPQRYIERIKSAEKAGYEVLIIDSLSHAWVGDGGVLSIAERAGGTFQQGWKTATPQHNLLVDTIVTSKMHIIVTLRSKTEYVVEANDRGKMAPRKVGMAPVQRDGLEYEFTMFMDMNQEHYAHITKDNTKLYDGQVVKPDKKMGENLKEWLLNGKSQEDILTGIKNEIDACATDAELREKYIQLLKENPSLKDELVILSKAKKEELEGLKNEVV